MNHYGKLMARLHSGEQILIDGATGTECDRRGVPQLENAWNGGAALSHPEIVRQIHEDYIGAGAQIVISNTFATHRHALRDAGATKDFEALNVRGIELAAEARERSGQRDVLVAGGMSSWSWTGDHPTLAELGRNGEVQAKLMADAGADLLMLEMMIDIDKMLTLLDAAENADLPVWVGVTVNPNSSGTMVLRNGEPFVDAIAALSGKGVPVLNIMHTEVDHIDAALLIARAHWDGMIGVYAHIGAHSGPKWTFEDAISPKDYSAAAERWLDSGVQVIGGCCGIRVEHIATLSKMMTKG